MIHNIEEDLYGTGEQKAVSGRKKPRIRGKNMLKISGWVRYS